MENQAENQNARDERRRDVRVLASGSVLVRGHSVVRGRLMNLSTGGLCLELADEGQTLAVAEAVAVELHLDRVESRWLAFRGSVLRIAGGRIALAFVEVPVAFGRVMSRAIASAIEAEATAHVLLVDPDIERRAAFAALMRRGECVVAEASTPLEAIAHLGGSAIEAWVIAIADTHPPSIANELRRFVGREYPRLEVVSLGTLTVAVMRVFSPDAG
jgi:PilZ domain